MKLNSHDRLVRIDPNVMVLNDLRSSLDSGSTGYLRGLADTGPDVELWDSILRNIPEEKRNWLSAPWMIAEFYLYRHVSLRPLSSSKQDTTCLQSEGARTDRGLTEHRRDRCKIADLLASNDKAAIIELAVLTSLWKQDGLEFMAPAPKLRPRQMPIWRV